MNDFDYKHIQYLPDIEIMTPDEWSSIINRIIEFKKTRNKDYLESAVKIIEA